MLELFRVVVLYGADKQPWAATRGALAGGIAGRQRSTAQWLEVLDSGQSEEAVDEEGNVVLVPRRGSDLAASNRQLDNAALATLVLERPRRRPLPRTLA